MREELRKHFDELDALFVPLLVSAQATLSTAELKEVQDFLDHDEYGLALETLLDIYTPLYGEAWETEFLEAESPVYARIDADRMFTFHMAAS